MNEKITPKGVTYATLDSPMRAILLHMANSGWDHVEMFIDGKKDGIVAHLTLVAGPRSTEFTAMVKKFQEGG